MEIKYPRHCASIVRNKTLSCDAWLQRATTEKGESPFEVFRISSDKELGTFASRFSICCISEGKPASGNVSLPEMEEIIAKSDFAKNELFRRQVNGGISSSVSSNVGTLPSCYTKKFNAGNLKGRTPVDVLINDEDGKEVLNNQYKFLQKNLDKYPKNQELMDAIMEASSLEKEGKLKQATSQPIQGEFVIFDGGMKPLIRNKDKNGNSKVYEVKITCEFEKNYPINVTVLNYFAPVEQKENGLLNVQKNKMDKSSLVANTMALTIGEWIHFIKSINRCIELHFLMWSKECFLEGKKELEKHPHSSTQAAPEVPTQTPTPISTQVVEKSNDGFESFEDFEDELPFNEN